MTAHSPRVSVVVPAYYSHHRIAASLEALRAQTYRDFETIVVNSSPEEHTGRIVSEGFPEVHFIQSTTRLLPHAARNRGVAISRGEILVFTDPDCCARADWLEQLVAAHDAGHPVVGGSMGLRDHGVLQRGVHLSKFFWLLAGLPAGRRRVICTANASYSRTVWDVIGPFDDHLFTGDAIHSWRAEANGFAPWFEPHALVEHHHDGGAVSYLLEFHSRGREFAHARARFEGWSRRRVLTALLLAPAVPLAEVARAGLAATRSGWLGAWMQSLPIQLILRAAWALGEARSTASLLARSLLRRATDRAAG